MDSRSGPGDALTAVQKTIWSARPDELAGAATAELARQWPGARAEILLIDYRQAFLVPVVPGQAEAFGRDADGEDVPMDNTGPGRAFAGQRPDRERSGRNGALLLHLPLTVQGERLGVLTVRVPGEPGAEPPEPEWLAAAAAALARAMKIAEAATDLFRRIRRRSRLTVAAEMQWDLLPPLSRDTGGFHLAGQLEPAYAVWGDNFDWAASGDRLTLTVSNGMGTGTSAAALTHLAVSALRNARRSGADIAEQAVLADQSVYALHRGERSVGTLLMEFELATGRVRVVDAGSPKLYRMRGNLTEAIEFDEQLPLGMFGDSRYAVEEFAVEPGDRLIVVSDGVHAALSPDGEPYGAVALLQALRDTRLQQPPEAVRALIRHYLAYYEGGEPSDDAVIVCIDWDGLPESPAGAAGPAPVSGGA
ncbi:PP2C family protein-serine/threonine phosphatase [Actinomadura verrucosospora]|uniref:Magnesium or manganese-dependent protein phosphatase n=1 Tax=Actinomadura verrucosospora TaxID=46165 RepID=A0A7D3VUW6_ACTVE|nr:PP2C family protein-serine/threonine phosphatase [Actinomadura verrucosospora]QKG23190.1 magnesium or manganese-dependent protein phosphatase [Actinomadura verrucosospora]